MKNDDYLGGRVDIKFEECAETLKAIAHPTRLRILKELKDGPKCVTDIKDLIDVSQPNLSQHLTILRKEGIISYKEDGKKRCYYILKENIVAGLCKMMANESNNEKK